MDSNTNERHVNVDDADLPPPPYSETDIYSNSAAPRSAASTTTSHTGFTPIDDASSTGDVIFTPPLTPRTSSNTNLEPQQPAPQPGASLYIESRPPPTTLPRDTITHTVKVESTSLPDDLPYQNDWASRDVTQQDWATFVNFLLPDHTTRGNEAIIERKLRSEGRSDASSNGRSQAEAQLEQMRENGTATTRTRSDIEATVRQWNDDFFRPRGISVGLDPEARMPGAWETEFENAENAEQPRGQQPQRESNSSMFGKLSIDSNGIRYGDTIVLDNNGIKINSLTMGSNGISFGGRNQQSGPADSSQRDFAEPSGLTGPPAPSWTFGGGSGWDRHRRDFRRGDHGPHHDWNRSCHGHRGGRHSADRGRRRHADQKDGHDRSSSVSSISSESSSSSESSIGSLPDYDDIKDHQLPLYAQRLQDWTSHPGQVRTRSDIKALKAELKAIPKGPVDGNFDRKALKGQIKGLQANWRAIKKAQRQTRKAHRRERRMQRKQRKAEKREYRNQKREMRRAHKELRRQGGPSHAPAPAPPAPPVPPVPPVPAARPVPPMPPAPPAPPAPTAGPNPPPWSHPWPRGCTGPSQRNSFFFGPDGPLGERGPFGSQGPFGERGPLGPHGLFGGRGWGGHWGRGGRGGCNNMPPAGPWGSRGPTHAGNPRDAPGAWPDDDHESGIAPQVPPPGAAATAKYKAVEKIEAEIDELLNRAADTTEGRGALEKEVEALTERLEVVRMEADEAYARELAQFGP